MLPEELFSSDRGNDRAPKGIVKYFGKVKVP